MNLRVPLEVVQRNYEMCTKRKGKLASGQTETHNAPGHERQVGDYDVKVGHGGLCQGNHPASATGICTRQIDEGTSRGTATYTKFTDPGILGAYGPQKSVRHSIVPDGYRVANESGAARGIEKGEPAKPEN